MPTNLFDQIQNDYKMKQERENTVRNELAAKEEVKDRLKDVLSTEVQESLDVIDDAQAAADLSETLDEDEIQDIEARRKAAEVLREKRLKRKNGGLFGGLFGKKNSVPDKDEGPTYDESFKNVQIDRPIQEVASASVNANTVISFDDDDEVVVSTPKPVQKPTPVKTESVKVESVKAEPQEASIQNIEEPVKEEPKEETKENKAPSEEVKAEPVKIEEKKPQTDAKTLIDGETIARLNNKEHKYELIKGEDKKQYAQRLFRDLDAFVDYFNKKYTEQTAVANA